MNRQSLFKIISISIGLLFGLLIAEIGFRAYQSIAFHNLDDIETGTRDVIQTPELDKTLGEVIQLSSEEKIIYELIPNSTYQFRGSTVRTNAQGYRGKNYPKKKKENTKRVIGLGDSVMFGWEVEEEDAYLSQLENELNENDSLNYEVINTGVPGYNTVMEVEVLKKRIDLSQVDLVIINFVANDYDLPNFIRKKPDFWSLKKSMILQFFEKEEGLDNRLGNAPFDNENLRFQRDPKKVPAEYRAMVGEESCLIALQELGDLSALNDFKVIFLSHSPSFKLPAAVQSVGEKNDFIFVHTKSVWDAYLEQNPTANFNISEEDFHPSKEGHTVISNALLEKVEQLMN